MFNYKIIFAEDKDLANVVATENVVIKRINFSLSSFKKAFCCVSSYKINNLEAKNTDLVKNNVDRTEKRISKNSEKETKKPEPKNAKINTKQERNLWYKTVTSKFKRTRKL